MADSDHELPSVIFTDNDPPEPISVIEYLRYKIRIRHRAAGEIPLSYDWSWTDANAFGEILTSISFKSEPKQHSISDLANKRKQMHSKSYRNQRRP